MSPQPTPGLCASCRTGDHKNHEPAFGSICVGCVCELRPEIVEAIETILAPHGEHDFGSCSKANGDLCDSCCFDSGIALARKVGEKDERERLKALVWKWSEHLDLTAPERDELAALFEVAS